METSPLLRDLAIVLAASLVAGWVTLRFKQPSLVGYLLAGMLIGPYGLRWIHDEASVVQLAEIGVILLMFALGVEFSLAQFKPLGRSVLFGGLLYMGVLLALVAGLAHGRGAAPEQAALIGCLFALSSTIIVMRQLMERQELGSLHGRVMLGWLILQDLAVVPMLIAVPYMAAPTPRWGAPLALVLLEAGAFLLALAWLGTRTFPALMRRIAYQRQRELFFLAAVTLCFGTAALSSAFGLSLALGAFLAGLILSRSDEQRQVLAEVLPLRDLFVTLFFVSLGMLFDPHLLLEHPLSLLAALCLVVGLKALVGVGTAWAVGLPPRGALFVGGGLAQIGEFSFVLAKEGQTVGLLDASQFSLLLGAALLSMLLTPGCFRLADALARFLAQRCGWRACAAQEPTPAETARLRDHVVLAGFGRAGDALLQILTSRQVPLLVIDLDRRLLRRLQTDGVSTLYGDAGMREVLSHAQLATARLLIINVPDPATTCLVLDYTHQAHPSLPVIVRGHRHFDRDELQRHGPCEVIQPEFEAGLALLRATLTRLGWEPHVIHGHLARLRAAPLETARLDEDADEMPPIGAEAAWLPLPTASPYAGRSLGEADLVGRTGASVLVVHRAGRHLLHPGPEHRLEIGDSLLVLGTPDQLEQVMGLLGEAGR